MIDEPAEVRCLNNVILIAQEMKVYEATGKRTPNLDLLNNALQSIPSTSIEAERAFSAAGLIVSTLRTQLSDRSMIICVF